MFAHKATERGNTLHCVHRAKKKKKKLETVPRASAFFQASGCTRKLARMRDRRILCVFYVPTYFAFYHRLDFYEHIFVWLAILRSAYYFIISSSHNANWVGIKYTWFGKCLRIFLVRLVSSKWQRMISVSYIWRMQDIAEGYCVYERACLWYMEQVPFYKLRNSMSF